MVEDEWGCFPSLSTLLLLAACLSDHTRLWTSPGVYRGASSVQGLLLRCFNPIHLEVEEQDGLCGATVCALWVKVPLFWKSKSSPHTTWYGISCMLGYCVRYGYNCVIRLSLRVILYITSFCVCSGLLCILRLSSYILRVIVYVTGYCVCYE